MGEVLRSMMIIALWKNSIGRTEREKFELVTIALIFLRLLKILLFIRNSKVFARLFERNNKFATFSS